MEKFIFNMELHFRHLTTEELRKKGTRSNQHKIERKLIKEGFEDLIPNEYLGTLTEFKITSSQFSDEFVIEAEHEEKAKRKVSRLVRQYFEKTRLSKFYKLNKINFIETVKIKQKLFKCVMTKSAILQISSSSKEQAIQDVRNLYLNQIFDIPHKSLINLNFEEIPLGSENPVSVLRFYEFYPREDGLDGVKFYNDIMKYDIEEERPYGFLNYVNRENLFKVRITETRSKVILFEFIDKEPTIEEVEKLYENDRILLSKAHSNLRIEVEEADENDIPHYTIKPAMAVNEQVSFSITQYKGKRKSNLTPLRILKDRLN